jgi:hypothetical protein
MMMRSERDVNVVQKSLGNACGGFYRDGIKMHGYYLLIHKYA